MTATQIKIKLLEVGATQAEIAERLHCHRSAIHNTIKRRIVSRRIQRAVAKTLGTSVENVFGQSSDYRKAA